MVLLLADAWLTCGLPIGIFFALGLIYNWAKADPKRCRLCQAGIKRKYYHADIDGQNVVLCPQCYGNIRQRASRMAVAAALGEPVKNRILTLPAVEGGERSPVGSSIVAFFSAIWTLIKAVLGLIFLLVFAVIGYNVYQSITKPTPTTPPPTVEAPLDPKPDKGKPDGASTPFPGPSR